MNSSIKQKTASGFIYKFAERAGAQGINFLVQIILARLLLPEDYGAVALVTVFITILDVFVTYGFGNSLIVDRKSDSVDFSTCFYFGLVIATVIYIGVFFGAPLFARFYDNPILIPVIRVMGLRLPIAAINSVQQAYVSKHMWFKKFFYANLIGTVLSGIGAVIMAYAGAGVWALVVQYMGNILIGTVCLWFIVKWRPTKEFSFTRLKSIYSYGWKILVVGLIDTTYGQLRSLIIGKKYSSGALAFYNQGNRFPTFGMSLIEPTVNTVLFPALSQCQDNQEQMREVTRKVIMVSTYIISPIMIGLAAVAKPLILFLLTEKWLPCVVFLQIGCFANLFRPNQFINNCVIRASGDSTLLLKLDIIKKVIGVVLLLISMNFGVLWIALSLAFVYFISMVINIAPNRKILNYGYRAQCKDFLKNLVPALIMGICVYPITFMNIRPILMLVIQIVLGVIIYLGISIVTKNSSFITTVQFVKSFMRKRSRKNF